MSGPVESIPAGIFVPGLGNVNGLRPASMFGLQASTVPIETANSSIGLIAGQLICSKFSLYESVTVTALRCANTRGMVGGTGTQGLALYDTLGNLLGRTVDATTAWTSTGTVDLALAGGPLDLEAGTYYAAALSAASTTTPILVGMRLGDTTIGNAGAADSALVLAGQTDFPNPAVFSAMSNSNGYLFVGVL